MTGLAEQNLEKLAIKLPKSAGPAANYVSYNYSCGHLYLSGQLPRDYEGQLRIGRLGENVTVEEGQGAARLCGIRIISELHTALGGNLDRVKKIVRLTCYINSSSEFTQQPLVANGCSDLLVSVFGEKVGRHARCAIGVAQLPFNVPVEIDAQVEIEGEV